MQIGGLGSDVVHECLEAGSGAHMSQTVPQVHQHLMGAASRLIEQPGFDHGQFRAVRMLLADQLLVQSGRAFPTPVDAGDSDRASRQRLVAAKDT
jgi:hypothetical protein